MINNEHREEIRELHRRSLVTAAVLISPDAESYKLYRADRVNLGDMTFALEDGWKFAALYGVARQPDMTYIVEFVILEGHPVDLLTKARKEFSDSITRDGILKVRPPSPIGNA